MKAQVMETTTTTKRMLGDEHPDMMITSIASLASTYPVVEVVVSLHVDVSL
jgi:hypothetical protein